ncbi:hypothetical protein [Pseudonocardia spirodelae]|uniref:RNA polymerase sigma-70 region 2 domain-containing protein n=1 Tax=Pseudonocardia spirodelae TaxID=3133431 RepID=A0ABU8TE20_9PSEU
MTVLERLWVWRVRAACEMALASRGGDELVDDARTEAAWYADLLHPWDGCGCEPDARVHAWLSILMARRTVAAHPLER